MGQINSFPINTDLLEASDVPYDNSASGLAAENVQDGIDELASEKAEKSTTINGYDLSEDRTLFVQDIPSKNLLPITATTTTISGVTFTVNDDGTISTSGTATADVTFLIASDVPAKAGTSYKLSGASTGTSAVKLTLTDNVHAAYNITNIAGDSYWNPPSDFNFSGARLYIQVTNGYNVDGYVFKPMLRLASIEDDTYVPYAKTNVELSDIVSKAFKWKTVYFTGAWIFTNCTGSVTQTTSVVYVNELNTLIAVEARILISSFTRTGSSPKISIQTDWTPPTNINRIIGARTSGSGSSDRTLMTEVIYFSINTSGLLTFQMSESYANVQSGAVYLHIPITLFPIV